MNTDAAGRNPGTGLCRHGIRLDVPCSRCGRVQVVRAPELEERRAGFEESLRRLEEIIEPLLEQARQAEAELRAMERDESAGPDRPGNE